MLSQYYKQWLYAVLTTLSSAKDRCFITSDTSLGIWVLCCQISFTVLPSRADLHLKTVSTCQSDQVLSIKHIFSATHLFEVTEDFKMHSHIILGAQAFIDNSILQDASA